LYHSTLSTLLSRCIRLKHSFFSLIAFYTFLFHHHVYLASRLLPLVTLKSSEVTFLMQVAIFIHMLFASPPSCQGPLLRTLSLNVFDAFFKFSPFCPWRLDVLTPLKANPKVKICYHKLMLRHDTLSMYHLTI
jgi:hypothetical protein